MPQGIEPRLADEFRREGRGEPPRLLPGLATGFCGVNAAMQFVWWLVTR